MSRSVFVSKYTPDYYGKREFALFGVEGRRIVKKHATRQRRHLAKKINDDYNKSPNISFISELKYERAADFNTYGW